MATLFLAFSVKGDAQPAGSKNSFVPLHVKFKLPFWRGAKSCKVCFGRSSVERCKKCNSQIIVNTVDSCKKSGPWKKFVGDVAKLAMKERGLTTLDAAVEGRSTLTPVKVILRFFQKRPGVHFRTGKFSDVLKDDAPAEPTNVPDVLKLARAVEDGMIGIVYKDDSCIVREVLSKQFGKEDRVDIEIWTLV